MIKDPKNELLSCKNPAEYIDTWLKIKTENGKAASSRITRIWLKEKGYTVKDLAYARHRHPYWKRQKLKGNPERTKKRNIKYNYSLDKYKNWTEKDLQTFLELNKKLKDHELAKHFKVSIQSIQYIRRKIAAINRIKKFKKISPSEEIQLLKISDNTLREMSDL